MLSARSLELGTARFLPAAVKDAKKDAKDDKDKKDKKEQAKPASDGTMSTHAHQQMNMFPLRYILCFASFPNRPPQGPRHTVHSRSSSILIA
jgi:hypothetical protein